MAATWIAALGCATARNTANAEEQETPDKEEEQKSSRKKGGGKKAPSMNDANPDKALTRFEFLEIIVRLGIAKYVPTGRDLATKPGTSSLPVGMSSTE